VLGALALAAMPLASTAGEPRILGDKEFYTKGSFIAWAGSWSVDVPGSPAYKRGVDYADEIAVHPETFPANVELSWHWPLTPPKVTGVYAYNAVSYGSYDGGVPATPITPRQVKDIHTLSENFRCTMARPVGDYNALTEFFLASKSNGEGKVAEIGFLLRIAKSGLAFANAGEQLGVFTDASGRAWKVAKQGAPAGPYYMFLPEGEITEGTVDFKGALDFLRAKGRITGEEWFTGLAFGVEPTEGSGSLKLEKLEVSYQ